MSDYVRQTWVAGESPLSAERMNHIEDGILGVESGVKSLDTKKADKTALTNPFVFKGSTTFASLPTSGNTVNDTYYVTDKKCKYTWNGSDWYVSSIDETDYENQLGEVKKEISELNSNIQELMPPSFNGSIRFKYFEYTDMKLYAKNSYVDNDGVVNSVNGWDVYRWDVPAYVRYCAFNLINGWTYSTYNGVVYKNDDNCIPINTSIIGGTCSSDWKYVLLNINVTDKQGFGKIATVFNQKTELMQDGKIIIDTDNVLYVNQYIDSDGSVKDLNGSQVSKIFVNENYKYYCKDLAYEILGYCYDKNGIGIGAVSKYDDNSLNVVKGTSYIGLNVSANAYIYAVLNQKLTIPNVISKPYHFKNENAVFFGDSITYGVASSPDSSTGWIEAPNEGYVPKFINRVGLNSIGEGSVNYGVPATTIAENVVEAGSITTKIKQVGISGFKFIFIAGGVNDYNQHVKLGDFNSTDTTTVCGALNSMITFLKSNITDSQKVIFILPINRICEDVKNNSGIVLEDIRRVIYEKAINAGFDVVNGATFGFPTINDNTAYSILYDWLHPTLLGHTQYAKVLGSIIGDS